MILIDPLEAVAQAHSGRWVVVSMAKVNGGSVGALSEPVATVGSSDTPAWRDA